MLISQFQLPSKNVQHSSESVIQEETIEQTGESDDAHSKKMPDEAIRSGADEQDATNLVRNTTTGQRKYGISIFSRPTNNVLNIDLKGPEVTLFLRPTKQVLDFSFGKDSNIRRIVMTESESMDERPTLESMQDIQWKPIQIDKKSLLEDYMKLSKIRLTGEMGFYFTARKTSHLTVCRNHYSILMK